MWIANGVNLALDLLLVPGTFGLPAMGAMGGAWATTGARTFLTVLLLVYIARMPEARDMGVFERPPRDRPAEAEQRRIGFGAGVSNFFEVAAFASMNLIAGWAGGMAVAAWAIVLNIMSVIFMVPLGLATGAAIRVGLACGARNPQGVARAGLVAFGVTAAFGGAISLIVWPSAARLAHAYTSDPATLALAIPALAIVGLALLPDALQVVVAQSLRARGDIWLPSGTHLASYMLIMMPLAWYLAIPRGLGVVGLVWAIIAASLMACGLLLGRFWQLTRRDAAITNA
jgi:MATE family multidrug resistance protein